MCLFMWLVGNHMHLKSGSNVFCIDFFCHYIINSLKKNNNCAPFCPHVYFSDTIHLAKHSERQVLSFCMGPAERDAAFTPESKPKSFFNKIKT